MAKCIKCSASLTRAPWRYDGEERGIHWVCPSDARVAAGLDEPVPLGETISNYLQTMKYRALAE